MWLVGLALGCGGGNLGSKAPARKAQPSKAEAVKAATAELVQEAGDLARRCENEPETVTQEDLRRSNALVVEYATTASQAAGGGYDPNPDMARLAGPLRACQTAFTQNRISPRPFKRDTKNGRTRLHYATGVVVAFEDPAEPHFYGDPVNVHAIAGAKTEVTRGCDQVTMCGEAGACPTAITAGVVQVVCVLEHIEGKHFRLVRPDGWEHAHSEAEKVRDKQRAEGWDEESMAE